MSIKRDEKIRCKKKKPAVEEVGVRGGEGNRKDWKKGQHAGPILLHNKSFCLNKAAGIDKERRFKSRYRVESTEIEDARD